MPIVADKSLFRSFAAGEIGPLLFSRLDLDKFQTGLALCLNMETLPQGPVQNRAGYKWVLETKNSSLPSILLPFSYSTQQTFALEFGDKYVRFHSNGGTLLENPITLVSISLAATPVFGTGVAHGLAIGNTLQLSAPAMPVLDGRWVKVDTVPTSTTFTVTDLAGQQISTLGSPAFGAGSVSRVYEIVTPYAAADLSTLHCVQSADVLTIVSPLYAPAELRRAGATNWSLASIQFTNALAAPQTSSASPNNINHSYMVIAAAPTNGGYSLQSNVATASNDLTIPGCFNRVSWTQTPGAVFYFVYKQVPNGGPWGLLGFSQTGTFLDDDFSKTPDLTATIYGPAVSPAPTCSAAAVTPSTTGVGITPTGAGATTYAYVVTSVSSDGKEESIASGAVSTTNDLTLSGHWNTIKWPSVPGVTNYNVYRSVNGIFGFVGGANNDCTFVDNNILPDVSKTPPIMTNPFNGVGNYPQAVTYHQQRRLFAGTVNAPQNIWATRSGTEKNLGYSFPSRDDDMLALRVVAREANTIRHMVPMGDLILLTSGGEWNLAASDGGALTPANVSVKPQGYTGASSVPPVVTDRTILFAQDRGGFVRELQFSWQQQGYQSSDCSILAPHLFQYKKVVQMAYTRSPLPALWSVRSDGYMLGMTYVVEHEVRAWHQHNTDGAFESACAVAEGDEDVVYAIVNRTINGRQVRYVECKHTRRYDTPADQFFVDSGLTYSGVPVSTFTGLYHLEGKTVSILADGGVCPQQVVKNGSVALDSPASKVQVGLPYVSQVQTLPLSLQMQGFGQGRVKNVNKVFLRVYQSQGFKAGPSFAKLTTYPARMTEVYGSPPSLITDEVPITLTPTWAAGGQVCMQQDQPLAFTLLGMTLEPALGG